jgi:hypothetical protein
MNNLLVTGALNALKDPNSYQLKLMSPVVSAPPLIADESEIPNGLILPE